jgi:hypothetical protein
MLRCINVSLKMDGVNEMSLDDVPFCLCQHHALHSKIRTRAAAIRTDVKWLRENTAEMFAQRR